MSKRIQQRVSITAKVKPSTNEVSINLPSRLTKHYKRAGEDAVLFHDIVIDKNEARDLIVQGFDLSPGLATYGSDAPEEEWEDTDEDQDEEESE